MANYDEIPPVLYDDAVCFDEAVSLGPERSRMAKVKLELDSLDPDGIAGLADAIIAAVTGNANFASPNPTLIVLGTHNTTLKAKVAAQKNAQMAAKQATADRDEALAVVARDLTTLAAYVESASGGDPVKIESAGMDVRSSQTPLVSLDRVVILSIAVGREPGVRRLKWSPISRARAIRCSIALTRLLTRGGRTRRRRATARRCWRGW